MDPPTERSIDGRSWFCPERLLFFASLILLISNFLLMLAVFLNFVGNVGPWNAGKTVWTAIGMDLVGAALLGVMFLRMEGRVGGSPRIYRWTAAALLFGWVVLTAYWRFALPAIVGTNLQDLFVAIIASPGSVPPQYGRFAGVIYELLYVWIASAAVFLAAHVVILLDSRAAVPEDWARGLPVYSWVLAAAVSLVATILIALSIAAVLRGGILAANLGAWLVAKMIVAPNIFISGYASSLQLGRSATRALKPTAEA